MLVLSRPAIYSLELTPRCTHRCQGCSNLYADDRTHPPLSAAAWRAILADIGPEATQIRLTGGEPTLHPEFLTILEAATAYDAWVTVFTHGDWRDPAPLIERLQGRPHFSGLLVSLHGATAASHEAFTRVPGSFERTQATIRAAVAAGITVAVSTILTRQSCDEIEAVLALARDLGAQHVAFNRYIGAPLLGAEPTLIQLAGAVRRIESLIESGARPPVQYGICVPQCFMPNHSEGCLAGAAYAAIDPWGYLHPCSHSPTSAGSLLLSSLEALWHGPVMDAWRESVPADCTGCAAYVRCHGGCRVQRELRPDRHEPLQNRPLAAFLPVDAWGPGQLPAGGLPRLAARIRQETFGYVLLGMGQAIPVSPAALDVLRACNGSLTLAELEGRFGPASIDLVGELWQRGLLELGENRHVF